MSGSASGRGGRGRKRGRSQRQAARDFHPNAAATRYVHEQIKAADTSLPDFSAMTRRKTKLVGKERSQAVCDGVRFLLLSMTGGNRGFTLADFKQAITRVKVLGKADALISLAESAAELRTSYGLCVARTLPTYKSAAEASRFGSVREALEGNKKVLFTVVSTTTFSELGLGKPVHKGACTTELARRGFLGGVLSLLAMAPGQCLSKEDLESQLLQLDPSLSDNGKPQTHAHLGNWQDLLSKFVAAGYLTRSLESASTATGEGVKRPHFRFGPLSRTHLGIAGVAGLLKELETGFRSEADTLMAEAGDTLLHAWFGLEGLQGVTPLPPRARKRSRAD